MLEKILEFWFGELQDGMASKQKRKIWYASTKILDEQITVNFKTTLEDAVAGKYSFWQDSPRGQLVLIILFDQFSRNIFRGQAEAFAFDDLALNICLQGIEQGCDLELDLIERIFYYHPLQHSEQLAHQELCVTLFKQLVAQTSGGEQQQFVKSSLKFVQEHRDIIKHYGRFPHRNAVLGRCSTAKELDYLGSGGKRFGQ